MIGEKQLFGPDIIEDAEQMVQAMRENLRIAQSRKRAMQMANGGT